MPALALVLAAMLALVLARRSLPAMAALVRRASPAAALVVQASWMAVEPSAAQRRRGAATIASGILQLRERVPEPACATWRETKGMVRARATASGPSSATFADRMPARCNLPRPPSQRPFRSIFFRRLASSGPSPRGRVHRWRCANSVQLSVALGHIGHRTEHADGLWVMSYELWVMSYEL